MTQKTRELLFAEDIQGYIARVAMRHFKNEEDRADARAIAWEKLEASIPDLSLAEYRRMVYRVINAKYKRWRRQHQREMRMA